MAGTLYIRLMPDRAEWLLRAPELFRAPEQGALEQAAALATGQRVVVLVPAAEVLLTEANIPTRQRQRLRQAVPYAIEEQLAEEVESLHFALAGRRAGGVPVAVVGRARMDGWLEQLAGAGLQPHALVPDALALPLAEGEWSLLLEAETAVLRTGPARGHALPVDGLEALLELSLAQAGEAAPARLRLFDARGDELGARIQARCAALAEPVETVMESCADGALPLMARGLAGGVALDLLQGDYSRREQLGKLWRPWRPAAAMAGVLLLLQGGMVASDYYRLEDEAAALSARVEEVYRGAFPDSRNVVNPRVQMERNLSALRGGGGGDSLNRLLLTAGPLLAGNGVELNTLRYKDGSLDVDLSLADLQGLDRLKQQLGERGLRVEIQSANSTSGKVEGRLQIREAR